MSQNEFLHEVETVNEMLFDMVNDIFLERQNVHGITSGDLEPILFAILDDKMEQLSKAIAEAVHYQTIWCKP